MRCQQNLRRVRNSEDPNQLIVIDVAVRIHDYESCGPISTDQVIRVVWKLFSALVLLSQRVLPLTRLIDSQNTSDRHRAEQLWSESLHHFDP